MNNYFKSLNPRDRLKQITKVWLSSIGPWLLAMVFRINSAVYICGVHDLLKQTTVKKTKNKNMPISHCFSSFHYKSISFPLSTLGVGLTIDSAILRNVFHNVWMEKRRPRVLLIPKKYSTSLDAWSSFGKFDPEPRQIVCHTIYFQLAPIISYLDTYRQLKPVQQCWDHCANGNKQHNLSVNATFNDSI